MKGKIVFFIDKQQFKTDLDQHSAADLLSNFAQEDPTETTLVLKKGNELTKYANDDVITIKNGMHFVVFHDGPTPVSYLGPEKLMDELQDLGYKPKLVDAPDGNQYVVLAGYTVELGKFSGRVIDIGFLATADFPNSVASAIHIKSDPQLYETKDTLKGIRNITNSALGDEWRYWSINFNWQSGSSARRLLSQINTVFQNA